MVNTSIDGLVVYHGICREKWSNGYSHPTELYLTDELSIAANYANEWAGEGMTPMIVSFLLSDMVNAKLELQPNWETVGQAEDGLWGEEVKFATWEDTIKANATFCVHGNIEKVKNLANIVQLQESTPAMA